MVDVPGLVAVGGTLWSNTIKHAAVMSFMML